MPRQPDVDFSTPTARHRLRPLPKSKLYWRTIAEGHHLGYRRTTSGAGTWWTRIYLGNGIYSKERSLGSADDLAAADGQTVLSYREALEVASAWWRGQRQQVADGVDPAKAFLVRDAVRVYRAWYLAHRKGIERNEFILRSIEEHLGDFQLAGPPSNARPLTKRAVRLWHQGIAETPAQLRPKPGDKPNFRELETDEAKRKRKNTANRMLTGLKAALNFAVGDDEVPKVMAEVWDVTPFKGADSPRIQHLETDQLIRLLNAISDPDFRALVEGCAPHTGCDYGELRRMSVGDFLPNAPGVIVREGKVASRSRVVYLSEEGVAFLENQTTGRAPSEPMFTLSGRRWKRAEQDRRIRKACADAGIPVISFHILRHTYASLYLMSGGALPALSKQLGHSDTRMTMRHYAHLAEHWRAADAGKHAPRLGNVGRLRLAKL